MPTGVYLRGVRTESHKKALSMALLGKNITHGMRRSRTYNSWISMKTRCNNPNALKYPHYGGRGIKVCEQWQSFEAFYADMGERPEGLTLDRINNDGNYEPSNCRWATASEQNFNRRKYGIVYA